MCVAYLVSRPSSYVYVYVSRSQSLSLFVCGPDVRESLSLPLGAAGRIKDIFTPTCLMIAHPMMMINTQK